MKNKVTQQILKLLDSANIWYATFVHKPVRTSQEAASVRPGYTLHQGAKAIILKAYLKGNKGKFILFVLAGDAHINKDVLRRGLGVRNFRFANKQELHQITHGVLPGGIPPFGSLFGLKTYVDKSLLDNTKIVFNAGDRGFSIAMNLNDYLAIERPRVLK